MPISYPDNPISIGDHIRKKRMDLKLFQKDVARILEVTEDCVANWEKNRNVPQVQFFPRITSFLGYMPFEIDETTFSGRLKAYRYMNGLSHKRMGTILDVDASTIGAWEKDEQIPTSKVLSKLEAIINS